MKKNIEKILGAEFSEFYLWSYNPHNKSWYEDGIEELPQPISKSVTGRMDVVAFVGAMGEEETQHDRDEIKEFVDYLFTDKYREDLTDYPAIWTEVHFMNDKQKSSGGFSDEGMWDLDKMIRKMKHTDKLHFYIQESCCFKFITWKVTEKIIRFAIFDYNHNDDSFLQCIFDFTADKELIIEKLESIIETWKEVILERIHYLETIKGKKFVNTKKIPVIDYFFPQFKADE